MDLLPEHTTGTDTGAPGKNITHDSLLVVFIIFLPQSLAGSPLARPARAA